MSSVMGEIPFVEVMPELWILDEQDLAKAQEIIHELIAHPAEVRNDWTCSSCGAEVAGVFSHCWQCGRASEEAADH